MKKFFMFLGVVAVLTGFSSCKKTCKCYMSYGRYTENLGKFRNFTKKQCKDKESTLDDRYNRNSYYNYDITCTLE